MWSLGVNTEELFYTFLDNLKGATNDVPVATLLEISQLENIPYNIELIIFQILIESAWNSDIGLLRIIDILSKMDEEKEFALGRTLQRVFAKLKVTPDHLDKFDHLSGLLEQEDLDEIPISAKQVSVLLSIMMLIRQQSGQDRNRIEPFVVSNVDGNITTINWNRWETDSHGHQVATVFENNGKVYLIDTDGNIGELSENYVNQLTPLKGLQGKIERCVRSESSSYVIVKTDVALYFVNGEKCEPISIPVEHVTNIFPFRWIVLVQRGDEWIYFFPNNLRNLFKMDTPVHQLVKGKVSNIIIKYYGRNSDPESTGCGLILCTDGSLYTFCDMFTEGKAEFALSGVESIHRIADTFSAVSYGGCLYEVRLCGGTKYNLFEVNIREGRGRISTNKERLKYSCISSWWLLHRS